MPANPSSSATPAESPDGSPEGSPGTAADGSAPEAAADGSAPEPQPVAMSRAERRAAARGKTVHHDDLHTNRNGKVIGARGPQSTRRQYSSRRAGG